MKCVTAVVVAETSGALPSLSASLIVPGHRREMRDNKDILLLMCKHTWTIQVFIYSGY